MRKILPLTLLAVASQAFSVEPSKVFLVCKGDILMFENWVLLNKLGGPPASMTVELNRAARTIAYTLPHTSTVTAPLEETAEYYWSTLPINSPLMGKTLYSVQWSINRYTGSANARYITDKEGRSGYGAFDGTCEPGKAKF